MRVLRLNTTTFSLQSPRFAFLFVWESPSQNSCKMVTAWMSRWKRRDVERDNSSKVKLSELRYIYECRVTCIVCFLLHGSERKARRKVLVAKSSTDPKKKQTNEESQG